MEVQRRPLKPPGQGGERNGGAEKKKSVRFNMEKLIRQEWSSRVDEEEETRRLVNERGLPI